MTDNGWIEHDGGFCPVDFADIVDIERRNGDRAFGFKAGTLRPWCKGSRAGRTDITRYRPTPPIVEPDHD